MMASSARAVLLTLTCLSVSASVAWATDRVVPDDFPTIQSAINAAVTGDRVIVRAGEYLESLVLANKDLVVVGESGASLTIVRAPVASRVVLIGPLVTRASIFRGFTFTGGEAASGGGAFIQQSASCTFDSCRFVSNAARGTAQSSSYGGGLYVGQQGGATIQDCEFVRNGAYVNEFFNDGYGGAIYAGSDVFMDVTNTRFTSNLAAGFEGGWGGAVALATASSGAATAGFQECLFDSNFAGYGGAIDGVGRPSIGSCVFRYNQGTYGASAVSVDGWDGFWITGSIIHDNESVAGQTVSLRGSGTMEGNTLAFNQAFSGGPGPFGCIMAEVGVFRVRKNIVARNQAVGIWCDAGGAEISCNDVWGNRDGEYGGVCPDLTGLDGNISMNPLFCDSTKRVFSLRVGSPCAPHDPCGLIGAVPVGCPDLAVPHSLTGLLELLPVRPNPTRLPMIVSFRLSAPSPVRLEIIDVGGRRIARLADEMFGEGVHEVPWRAGAAGGPAVRPGIYFVRLEAAAHRLTRTIVVID